jgi:hypothetical protein
MTTTAQGRVAVWYLGTVTIAGVCWLYLPAETQAQLSAETLKTLHTHRLTVHLN